MHMTGIPASALFLCAISVAPIASLGNPAGTSFTYQGQLKEGGKPANGVYDLLFRVFNAPTGGTQIGGNVPIGNQQVSNGLLSLRLDFGPGVFSGDAVWLQVAIRPGAAPDAAQYTPLSPRQALTPSPYALYALDGPSSAGHWTGIGTDIYNNNSGNVGIRTSTPGAKLDVAGTTRTDALEIDGTGPGTLSLSADSYSGGILQVSGPGALDGTVEIIPKDVAVMPFRGPEHCEPGSCSDESCDRFGVFGSFALYRIE